jgi:hypothetical protein
MRSFANASGLTSRAEGAVVSLTLRMRNARPLAAESRMSFDSSARAYPTPTSSTLIVNVPIRRCYGCLPFLKGEKNWSAEMEQPLIRKKSPSNRGGSSDGYGIKVPKA